MVVTQFTVYQTAEWHYLRRHLQSTLPRSYHDQFCPHHFMKPLSAEMYLTPLEFIIFNVLLNGLSSRSQTQKGTCSTKITKRNEKSSDLQLKLCFIEIKSLIRLDKDPKLLDH